MPNQDRVPQKKSKEKSDFSLSFILAFIKYKNNSRNLFKMALRYNYNDKPIQKQFIQFSERPFIK